MNTPLPINEIPSVCRLLRTKAALGNYVGDDFAPWETAQSPSAAYWCLSTMTSAGPDDAHAHPTICQAGRRCFQLRD